MKSERISRLFLTGPMRSGTTLTAREISTRIFGRPPLPEATPISDVLALANRWRSHYEPSRYATWIATDSAVTNFIRESVDRILHTADPADRGVVAKCPEMVRYPSEFVDLLTERSLGIVIVREPLDVIASAREVHARQDDGPSWEYFVAAIWDAYAGLETLLGRAREEASRIHAIRFEQFVADPASQLSDVATWLGRPMRTDQDAQASAADEDDPFFTSLMNEPPSSRQVGNYTTRLEATDLDRYTEMFGGVRSRLGYV